MKDDVLIVFTPKGLHNKAQGRERSERTLGTRTGSYNRASPYGHLIWEETNLDDRFASPSPVFAPVSVAVSH